VIGRHRPPPPGPAPELVLAELLGEQRQRFADLDRDLPEAPAPPPGDVVVVDSTAGRAAGVVTRHTWPTGSGPLLWSASEVTELYPVLGRSGPAAADALLTAWRSRLGPRLLREPDSAAVVTWPSRDVAATRVMLDRGLVPLAVLAVRPIAPVAPVTADPGLRVRRAGPSDLEDCLRLALEELTYSSQVGGSVVRPDAEAVKRTTLRDRLARGEPTWLAERAGVAVGLLECGHAEAAPGTWLAGLLPAGRWGYVNCASVSASERGSGVGRALLAEALPVLQEGPPGRGDVRGTYLYYNPPNPVSSVFWPRQGYRPLWTLWETRPASGLR
jgi:GNAT superfamily N-acetyltransferase